MKPAFPTASRAVAVSGIDFASTALRERRGFGFAWRALIAHHAAFLKVNIQTVITHGSTIPFTGRIRTVYGPIL